MYIYLDVRENVVSRRWSWWILLHTYSGSGYKYNAVGYFMESMDREGIMSEGQERPVLMMTRLRLPNALTLRGEVL